MKLQELSKKFPKAFKKYADYRQVYECILLTNDDIRNEWKWITDFMDKQGIVIDIFIAHKVDNALHFQYIINEKKSKSDFIMLDVDYFKTRKQAETYAISKTFKILEERIKK